MTWDIESRPQKEDARSYALSDRAIKHASLWLPGESCLCLMKALESGVLSPHNRVIAVERDARFICGMRRSLNKIRWHHAPYIFQGDLADLKIPWLLDFAFLDFLGGLESSVAYWMTRELVHRMVDGSNISITQSYGWRNNKFMYLMYQSVQLGWRDVYREFRHHLRIYDTYIVFPLFIFKCIFNRFDFAIRCPMWYQDTVRSMIVYKLENFRHLSRGTNGWPTLDEVVNFGRSNLGDRIMKSKSSKAAMKSWETRRANEEAVKRSEAAKKAWKTRRNGNDEAVIARDVITALVEGRRGRNQLFDRYVEQQIARYDMEETRVRAAIKAHVTRRTA